MERGGATNEKIRQMQRDHRETHKGNHHHRKCSRCDSSSADRAPFPSPTHTRIVARYPFVPPAVRRIHRMGEIKYIQPMATRGVV